VFLLSTELAEWHPVPSNAIFDLNRKCTDFAKDLSSIIFFVT